MQSDDQFSPHIPALSRYARSLTNAPGEADDLVQETLQRALRALGSGRIIDKPCAYLMSTLHNLRMDALRKKQRQFETVDAAQEDVHDTFSATAELKLTCQDVMNAIANLRNDYREILLLAGPGEMTCPEMAALLNIPLGTVLSRLSRARVMLRQVLSWDGLQSELAVP